MAEIAVPLLEVSLRALLVPLMRVAGFVVARGLIFVAVAFVGALFGAAEAGLGWIPWVGSAIKGSLHSIQQRLTNALGEATQGIDTQIAAALHQLSQLVRWIGSEIQSNAGVLVKLAELIANPLSVPAWRGLLKSLHLNLVGSLARFAAWTIRVTHIESAIRHAEHGYIGAAIHTVTRPIVGELHGLERWTYPRVKAAEHAIDVTIPNDIAGLRARTRTIEDGLAAAWAKIKTYEAALATTAFAGAVAVALSSLGLGGLRCSNFTNLLKQHGCGLGTLLGRLLPLAVFLTIAFDFEDFVKASRVVATGLGDAVQSIEGHFPLSLPPLPPPRV